MIIQQSVPERKIVQDEEAYEVTVYGSIASAGTLNCHIENPSDSGVRLVLTDVRVSSKGPATIAVPHEFDLDSTGTATSTYNRARGSPHTATGNAYKDSTWSSADDTFEKYIGSQGESAVRPSGGGAADDVIVTITENQNYVIEVTNDDGSNAHDISITVAFYETTV